MFSRNNILKLVNKNFININIKISNILCRLISEKAWTCVKVGKYILVDGDPYRVTKCQQGGRGRGGSFVKCVAQNLYNSKTIDRTFNADDQLEIPFITFSEAQYSWLDSNNDEYVFLDSESFEEVRVKNPDKKEFLQEGQNVKIKKYGDRIIDVELPVTAVYTVVKVDNHAPL